MVKYGFFVTGALLILQSYSQAQETGQLTLSKAYELAEKNYPVTRQSGLVEQTAALTISNLSKGYLPQVSVNAQATYQSDVTKVSVPIAGFNIEPLSKDQYKLVADINQLVWDGGVIRRQKQMQLLNAGVEEQKVQVELYKLKERVNQVYLGVLYLDEQLKQVELVIMDLETGIKRVEAQVQNGVAFRSSLNVLKAEFLKTGQRKVELAATRKGLVETLGLFLGQTLPDDTRLEMPVLDQFSISTPLARPEITLFQKQADMLSHQQNLISARNLPKASLFLQGGYGRPGLNMLKNGFDLFYIGGVRLNWSLSGFYTKRKEKELAEINKKMVDVQQETFLLNTNTQLKQQQSEIEKLQLLVAGDEGIIDLRRQVKEAARAQLENGVITANDYLREVNAEDLARQARITHQLQLLQAQINYQTITGK